MTASDLVVTKPGGLTSSEALACGTPLVLVDPVPGQEERNSDLLLEQGAAIKANHWLTLPNKVTALLRDPGRLNRMRANARAAGRPRAAFEVVQRSLALAAAPVS
jgi:processive 1,2-diacylglycerol beta-glucosyltransferase